MKCIGTYGFSLTKILHHNLGDSINHVIASPFIFFLNFLVLLSIMTSCSENVAELNQDDVNKWIKYDQSKGLAENRVFCLYEDNIGKIWMGHESRGISVLGNNGIEKFNEQDGLLDNTVYAITQDPATGTMWIGTNSGLCLRDVNGNWTYYTTVYGYPFSCTALYTDKENRIWIGTFGYGYISYREDEGFEFYYDDTCVDCNVIYAFLHAASNEFWVGTGEGLIRKFGNQTIFYTKATGLPDNDVRTLYEDSWGNLWVGTLNGKDVAYFNGSSFTPVSLYNGEEINGIFGISEIGDGRMWIGSVVYGLMYYDGGVVRTVGPGNGPGLIYIYDLITDQQGNLWAATDANGAYKYISP